MARQPITFDAPKTRGMCQHTPPVENTQTPRKSTIDFGLVEGSRRVSIKDFSLKAAK